MSTDDEKRWDERYAAEYGAGSPASFLREVVEFFSERIAAGKALDIATAKKDWVDGPGISTAASVGRFGDSIPTSVKILPTVLSWRIELGPDTF